MHIQNAPKSTDKNTVVIASRDAGGFWGSVVIKPRECETRDYWGKLVKWVEVDWDDFEAAVIDAELCDEHYISVDGEDVTEEEARKALTNARA